ncbi:MAG: hypothetical protein Q7U64_02510 [Desulfocapsaceae bacterium]|nr:hypothetical protein [Desulfocapsaceae bacterium]
MMGQGAGHLLQELLVLGVGGEIGENLYCRLRGAEVRLPGLGKGGAGLGDLVLSHPADEKGLAALAGQLDHRHSRFQRLGHGLRRQNHQDAIDTCVIQAGLDRQMIAVRLGIADDVHRISVRPAWR